MTTPLIERSYFESLSRKVIAARRPGEHFFLNLSAESSQFIRLNSARVRQLGTVEEAELHMTLVLEGPGAELRTGSFATTLTGLSYIDQERVTGALARLRREVPELPVDPYAQLPRDHGSSEQSTDGVFPAVGDAVDAILGPVGHADIAGIFAAGSIVRAMANTAGQLHWFSTSNFSLDYSLYTPFQRALKGTFAGTDWNQASYRLEMERSRERLRLLERPARRIERGEYRTYLAPAAFSELVHMLSWGGVSEASIRQGDSPLRLMRPGGSEAGEQPRRMSGLFSLAEDFGRGMVPRFNGEGELAPMRLALIERGQLAGALVSSRTGAEYGVPSNGAEEHEALRSPAVAPGGLRDEDALQRLGTGLYLSNLHYLNWSDQPGGRITGMTRYACFWVEGGELVAPIENLRFDDSIFSLFGSALEDLGSKAEYLPEVGTYEQRSLGGISCPSALLSGMKFTL